MHRSAPALFFCFDRVVIFIRASLSAKITVCVLGVWKSSLPRSGKEWEAAFLMHNARKKLSVGVEAVVLVVRMGACQRLVRMSAGGGQILAYVLGLVLQGAVHGGMKLLTWVLASRRGSSTGSEVWAFSSTEEPALGGLVTALSVLQKALLFSRLVDVSFFFFFQITVKYSFFW